MAEPFLSEIRIMSFVFAPKGWALCDGQLLAINQNQALFSLLGTTYGGNGQTTFALPDLRRRVPIHFRTDGPGHTLGESGGEASHTLTISELPAHTHLLTASTRTGDTAAPTNNMLADTLGQIYAAPANLTSLNAASVTNVGGSQA